MISSQFQAIANHLWQSTLFVCFIGVLALVLRRNQARVRYSLWLAASLKFLVPFSMLIALGSQFGRQSQEDIPSSITLAVDYAEPFAFAPIVQSADVALNPRPTVDWMPTVVWAIWAGGTLLVLCRRLIRLRLVRDALRGASLVDLPGGLRGVSSPAILEPGVFGISRPILMLPAGIEDHLTQPQLEAVLAHELAHVRRRDNLTALLHMTVETLFWFHPLIWWIGARLMDERERACDEEVLRSGRDPHVYAEGILRICELYLESPVAFVAGVSGANLKNRIEAIMSGRIAPGLNFARKAVLSIAGIAAIAAPIAIGAAQAPPIRTQATAQATVGQQQLAHAAQLVQAPQSAAPAPQEIVKPTTPADRAAGVAGRSPSVPKAAEQKKLAFEAASIRLAAPDAVRNQVMQTSPNRLQIPSMTLTALIYAAYGDGGLNTSMRVTGGPDWINKTAFSVEGVASGPATPRQLRLMLQPLLEERFALKIRSLTETGVDVLALVVDRSDGTLGPKVKKWDGACPRVMPALYLQAPRRPLQRIEEKFVVGQASEADDPAVPYCPTGYGPGGIRVDGATMLTVAGMLSLPPARALLGTITQDHTGLTDRYTLELDYLFTPSPAAAPAALPEFAGPSLSTAVREQWGLRLAPSKGQLKVIVVESAQPPTDN